MIIDTGYSPDKISNFAKMYDALSPSQKEEVNHIINGDKDYEFYVGLLTGYANALAALKQLPVTEIENQLTLMVAVVAKECMKKREALGIKS